MLNLGVETVFLIVNFKKELIKAYIKKARFSRQLTCKFIEQKELNGIAHAISLAEPYLKEEFVCILGDDFSIANLQKLVERFYRCEATVVEGAVKETKIKILKSTCCMTAGDDNKILKITEKPSNPSSNLRGTGVYIFSPEIFKYIRKTPFSKKRNEIEITDTINLVAKERKAYFELLDGINININTLEDLFKAWSLAKNAHRNT